MDTSRFDAWTRRRFGAAALGLAAIAALGGRERAVAKRKLKKRKVTTGNLCTKTGQRCKRAGKSCKRQFCLTAPFTITAAWTVTGDHDTFLFLPPQNDETGPAPHIDWECSINRFFCEIGYPFACVEGGSLVTGGEVTTIYKLLEGRYEYWLELVGTTAAGEVVVTVRDQGGRVVRRWKNPANTSAGDVSWHAFDIDGAVGSIISVDEVIDDLLPRGAHSPSTYVCPI